jgi:hypothetical protein
MYLPYFAKPVNFFGARDHVRDLVVRTHESARMDASSDITKQPSGARRLIGFR